MVLMQDELRKFIKFACNQERIPFGHPCRDGARDSGMHVPPYPMKIAPPDGKGEVCSAISCTIVRTYSRTLMLTNTHTHTGFFRSPGQQIHTG